MIEMMGAAIKKNEIPSFAAMRTELLSVMLSEIRQARKDKWRPSLLTHAS
jgi:hypothetical protein